MNSYPEVILLIVHILSILSVLCTEGDVNSTVNSLELHAMPDVDLVISKWTTDIKYPIVSNSTLISSSTSDWSTLRITNTFDTTMHYRTSSDTVQVHFEDRYLNGTLYFQRVTSPVSGVHTTYLDHISLQYTLDKDLYPNLNLSFHGVPISISSAKAVRFQTPSGYTYRCESTPIPIQVDNVMVLITNISLQLFASNNMTTSDAVVETCPWDTEASSLLPILVMSAFLGPLIIAVLIFSGSFFLRRCPLLIMRK